MARTVRNPMEKRTPVRTISSVMRNAPRQVFTPQRIDRSVTRKTPISQAVESTFAPPRRDTSRPVAPITSTTAPAGTRPVAPITTKTTKPATTIRPASPAVKSSGTTAKTPAVKPVTSATKPSTKPATKPITTPTTKPAVNPITSKTTTPTAKTPTKSGGSSLTSVLNNPIAKTLIGAGAGALAGKIFGKPTTGGGTTGGTTPRSPSGPNLPSMGGGQGLKPPANVLTPKTGGTPAGGTPTRGLGTTTGNGTLTDEQVQAELDRVKASEETTLPEGAVANGDGTYTVVSDGMRSTYDSNGSLIGMEADTTGGDTTVAGNGYYQDDSGNIYDNDGNLLYSLGSNGEYYDPNGDLIYDPNADTTVAENNTWTDPETNQTWTLGADGSWTSDGNDYVAYDDTQNTEDTLVSSNDETEYPTEEFSKDGGYISMAHGGKAHAYAEGDLVTEDGEISNTRVNPETGDLYSGLAQNEYGDYYVPTGLTRNYVTSPVALSDLTEGDSSSQSPVASVDLTGVNDNGDGTSSYWDGDYYVTVDNDTGTELYRTDANGQTVQTEAAPVQTNNGVDVQTDDYGNTIITDANGKVTVYDPEGNLIPVGGGRETVGPITSVGGGKRPSYATLNERVNPTQNTPDQTGILDQLKNYVTQNPGLAGGAIGALLSSLMSQAGDSSSAGPSQPVDISALTAINPRTTDFGPGMVGGRTGTGSPIVSYQDYAEGYGDETPDERLYADLGISGYLNEPDMTDYVDESGNPVDQYGNYLDTETAEENAAEPAEEPTMASGGPTTHYTFGRVIDPAQNLGIGQGMKKGGLSQAHTVHSHHTNPVIDDRVDFRKGSAVNGAGDGQSDDIPAWLADGEYVIDAELVSMLGNGSNKAGAKVLDKFREEVRNHKRSAPLNKIPPKAKSPLNYLKEAMNG